MTHETKITAAAAALRGAYNGGAISPLRESVDPTDVAGAYAIQDANTQFWLSKGRNLVGRKIGLTAKAVQTQLGVNQPDFGALFEDMRIADGGNLNPGDCLQPKAEAEVALILGRDLETDTPTPEDILNATDHAVAAIEIVDSRIENWKITFADTVADNGSSAFFVLGSNRVPVEGLDLYACGMVLEVNQAIKSVGAGAACLDHPLNAAAWLAQTLAARGEPLNAGDIMLTGALGPMVDLTPGDEIKVTIGGLGEVRFNYGRTQ